MTEQALAKQEGGKAIQPIDRIRNYLLSPEVRDRFEDMMGSNAIYYLNQVLIQVANSNALQACEPRSILISAMRAASLRLSVDPVKGQAWIIPYKGTATFQLGYKGIYEMAMRTNQYKYLNVYPIKEGEVVTVERRTGLHTESGKATSDKVIGWMLYFQLFNGYEKTFYMTVEEIEAHARQYSQAYRYDLSAGKKSSKWSDPVERAKMERKTVLSCGLRLWGRFNEADQDMLNEIESEAGEMARLHEIPNEDEVTDPNLYPKPAGPGQLPSKVMDDLGFDNGAELKHEAEEVKAQPQPEPQPAPEPQKPDLRYQPAQLKTRLAEIAKTMTGELSNGKKGIVIATLENTLGGTQDPKMSRQQVQIYLTGHASAKDIPDNLIHAMYAWLKPAKDTGGEYIAEAMAAREVLAVFNEAQPKQETLI